MNDAGGATIDGIYTLIQSKCKDTQDTQQQQQFPSQSASPASMDSSNNAGNPYPAPASDAVCPLDQLTREPAYIQCPNCNQRAQTEVKGRSKGMERFMNVFWWPLPGRRHWWEEVKW